MLTRDERDFAKHIGIVVKKGLLLYKGREAWSEGELKDYFLEIQKIKGGSHELNTNTKNNTR